MNDERLAEIQERLEKATPGPWPEDYVYNCVRHIARNCEFESVTDPDFGWDRYTDADFIAHSREDIPYLLAENAALNKVIDSKNDALMMEAEIERLKGANDNLTDAMDQAVTYLKVVTDAMYECVFCGATKDEEGHRGGCEVTAALVIMKSRTNSVTAQVATLTAENAELKRRIAEIAELSQRDSCAAYDILADLRAILEGAS